MQGILYVHALVHFSAQPGSLIMASGIASWSERLTMHTPGPCQISWLKILKRVSPRHSPTQLLHRGVGQSASFLQKKIYKCRYASMSNRYVTGAAS